MTKEKQNGKKRDVLVQGEPKIKDSHLVLCNIPSK